MTHLQICLKAIETKFAHGNAASWTHKVFVQLSEAILAESGIYISVSSLKRLFGKIEYDSTPQKDTLNALAKYLDFDDWTDFKAKNSLHPHQPNPSSTPTKRPFAVKFLLGAIAALVITTGLFLLRPTHKDYSGAAFMVKESQGVPPFNLVLNYDIQAFPDDDFYVDFDDFTTNPSQSKEPLPRDKNTITHTYHYSDINWVGLYSGDSLIDKIRVEISSKEWEHVIALYSNNEYFKLTAANPVTAHGSLFVSPLVIAQNNFDTIHDYWMKHRIVLDASLDGDNFNFSTRVRNVYNPGSNNCPEVDFTVLTENESFKFKLFSPGCGSAQTIHRFGEVEIDGKYADLSPFGKNLSEWQNVRLEVQDKHVQLLVNESPIFDTVYTVSCGAVKGILYNTKRSAECDYFRLSNVDNELVWSDEFE